MGGERGGENLEAFETQFLTQKIQTDKISVFLRVKISQTGSFILHIK